ncbi:MAG: DUF4340 domain-containing protein [Oscillatoriaceae bacterium SKW80]|nr:DUF4340 domain-containing protein [Oscillatoriaceae bacterium SKYG93]MCX8121425.1 DUF4340 domain-containing protein [Oscillatoriaceae bacterium SKW80]MDW8451898.1 DUF4340 domain-containing protein [Oscillatoriaceae cyanobacterium SKYGB_i_bin93]HIK29441.1 DUF4340 domain-containing protein [Oscillatoriaceae cyanobacterium M7585_C2015_266]
MKFQRSTLILLLSALLLGGFVYVYEIQGAPQREAAKSRQQQIFSFPAADVQSLTVTTKTQTLMFERNNPPKTNQSKWLMKVIAVRQETQQTTCPAKPADATSNETSNETSETSTPANCATPSPAATKVQENKPIPAQDNYVDYLLNLLTTGKSEHKILMSDPVKQRREFGLEAPQATVELKLKNQETHRFILGNPNFNNSAYYAQIQSPNSKTENLEVLLVSTDLQNAVARPLSDWKKEDSQQQDKNSKEKPSANTPKPKPTPKEDSQ